MARFIALALVFLLSVSTGKGADTAPVAVTITKRAPIETLSPTGEMVGVSEATVGTRLTLVSAEGAKVILQDAQGTRYRIALSSTDYSPPPTTVAVVPTTASPQAPAPAAITNAVVAPAKPINAMPLPPAHPAPEESSAALSQNKQTPLADSPVFTIKLGKRTTANEMSVWPEGGVPDRPLLIAAHGNGGAGPREIQGWLQLAKQHRFTIVCPSFLSSVNSVHLSEDEPYFKDCLSWIKDNLKYNGDNVFMVGFSGGGFPTWCLATKHPDFFHGIAFQSGNFAGGYYDLSLSRWFNKPIKLIWGSEDLEPILTQNKDAVAMLKSEHCRDYTTEVVPGGHHQEHPDIVVSWMEQNLAPASSNELK
jgi:poly(3-hydroxybutyrate) depolymerase